MRLFLILVLTFDVKIHSMSVKTYYTEQAEEVTFENLPQELQERLTKSNVGLILEMKFLADDENVFQTARMCEKQGLNVTVEDVEAVIKAEEVYLRQIGVM